MPNPCSFCPANCCKSYTITVTAFDVLRAASASGKKPDEFATLHRARLLAFDPDTTLDIEGDGWSYILGFKSHPCAFLSPNDLNDDKPNAKKPNANACTIHASAPLSCRRYPFQLDGKLSTRMCPLASQLIFRLKGADVPTNRLVRELELHKKLVKEWNNKPGKKDACIAFLLKRAKETGK
jgi:Fe-S-cluster containining protein